MISQLVDKYLHQATLPGRAIAGLLPVDLDAIPVEGTWSIREIILHLTDSDLIASERMKRIIAEDNPTLVYCDETAAIANLPCARLDAALACEVFEKNRLLTAQILRHIPAEMFDRRGTHSRAGPVTLLEVLTQYVKHVPHHLKFLLQKRRLLGKPLDLALDA